MAGDWFKLFHCLRLDLVFAYSFVSIFRPVSLIRSRSAVLFFFLINSVAQRKHLYAYAMQHLWECVCVCVLNTVWPFPHTSSLRIKAKQPKCNLLRTSISYSILMNIRQFQRIAYRRINELNFLSLTMIAIGFFSFPKTVQLTFGARKLTTQCRHVTNNCFKFRFFFCLIYWIVSECCGWAFNQKELMKNVWHILNHNRMPM